MARDVNGDIKDEPFFEEGKSAPQNVSALIGKTAFLTCVVRNLGKAKSVSLESKFFLQGVSIYSHKC